MARLKDWSRGGFSPFIENPKAQTPETVERPAQVPSDLAVDCATLIQVPEFQKVIRAIEQKYMEDIHRLAKSSDALKVEKVTALMNYVAMANDLYSFVETTAQGKAIDEKNRARAARGASDWEPSA